MAYPAANPIQLQVKGMTCANCALGVEKYLKNSGQEEISVSLAAEEVRFLRQRDTQLEDIIRGIERLGFRVVTGDSPESEQEKPWQRLEWLFGFCLLWTLPLLAHMFLSWHWLHNPWVQLLLVIPVYGVGVFHFGRSAYFSVKNGVPNMDVLIIIGATAAFVYSLYGTLFELGPDFLFYETAASIITLVLLGNMMEYRAVKRTTTALQELGELQVETAKLVNPFSNGPSFQEVPIDEVNKGSILQINEGDRIPLDGEIVSGQGEVDEAAITGESFPRAVGLKEQVVGGTL
ncbi:MAG: cation transporter, partial [Bacteroidota bacterium]